MKYYGMFLLLISLMTAQFNNTQLDQLIQTALKNNPGIQAMEADLMSKQATAHGSGFYPDPQISAGYFFTPVETKTGPQEWKLGLRQMIPGFGKLSSKKQIAMLRADIAFQKLQQAKLNLRYNVSEEFEKLKLLHVEAGITQDNLRIFRQLEAVVRSKYTTSTASQAQLIQIQLEILKLEDQLESLTFRQLMSSSRLQRLLGTEQVPTLEFTDAALLTDDLPPIQGSDYLANPQYIISMLNMEISNRQVRLSKLSYVPDFSVGIDYISLGGDAQENPLMGSLGLSLPVWPGKTRRIRQAADAGFRSAENNVRDTAEQLSTQIEIAVLRLKDLGRKYKQYVNEMIPLAEQSYNVAETGYLAESLDFPTLLEAERNLLTLQLSAARTRHDYSIAQLEYELLTGKF